MKDLDNQELCKTCGGGTSITGSLVDAVVGGLKVIYDIGKNLGFSIRHFTEGTLCPIL